MTNETSNISHDDDKQLTAEQKTKLFIQMKLKNIFCLSIGCLTTLIYVVTTAILIIQTQEVKPTRDISAIVHIKILAELVICASIIEIVLLLLGPVQRRNAMRKHRLHQIKNLVDEAKKLATPKLPHTSSRFSPAFYCYKKYLLFRHFRDES